ncbi:winged helix-turn-helix domain-containing protein [Natronomonas gomsonensis]|uniref:ArsR/SmtB family transcription factor n=1 Tax=Natronomonas gomsonensis TaxID=1046043 RepID=UPI0020CA842A|nr:winged helix-turn-helix domain-containing protein [Natronomonas gomsonensis]MCY4731813.1 winged helix-turn-helix domain-containing protein [Natronomonas gomsonensis]
MSNAHPATKRVSPRNAGLDVDLEGIAALLEDEHARSILRHTSDEPLSARELMDRCGTSKATTYRRIDRLREHDLIETRQRHDPDGHHCETYVATFEAVTVEFVDGSFEVSLDRSHRSTGESLTVDTEDDRQR